MPIDVASHRDSIPSRDRLSLRPQLWMPSLAVTHSCAVGWASVAAAAAVLGSPSREAMGLGKWSADVPTCGSSTQSRTARGTKATVRITMIRQTRLQHSELSHERD